METVFNHFITPKEWEYIGNIEKKLYLSVVDVDSANKDIAALYFHRGDNAKGRIYAEKLPPEMKEGLYRTISHP